MFFLWTAQPQKSKLQEWRGTPTMWEDFPSRSLTSQGRVIPTTQCLGGSGIPLGMLSSSEEEEMIPGSSLGEGHLPGGSAKEPTQEKYR